MMKFSARLNPDTLLFVALILISLLPLWSFRYFPSQDGPNHLYGANILLHYNDRDADLYRQFYEINCRPDPNWLSPAALAGLLALAPPRIAEKLLLSFYLILLPLGMRYALRSIRPGAESFAVLVFPLLYNWMFHMGFYNFDFSLAMLLFALGYWIRHQERPRLRHGFAFSGLLLVLFFCHLVSFGMCLIACLVLAGWSLLKTRNAQCGVRNAEFKKMIWRRIAFTILPFLLPLALAFLFLGRQDNPDQHFEFYFIWAKFAYLRDLTTTMLAFDVREITLSRALAAVLILPPLFAFTLRLKRRAPARRDALGLVVLAWLAAYLLAPPSTSGGTFLYHRMGIYVFFGLTLWLGAAEIPPLLSLIVRSAASCLAIVFFAFYAQSYAKMQKPLEEFYSAAEAIPPHSVITSVCLDLWGAVVDGQPWRIPGIMPFINAASILAMERGCVNLNDYEGRTDYFPLRFRPAFNPDKIPGGQCTPESATKMQTEGYERATGKAVDAIVVWDDLGLWNTEQAASIRAQVEKKCRLAFESKPNGWMKVYLKK